MSSSRTPPVTNTELCHARFTCELKPVLLLRPATSCCEGPGPGPEPDEDCGSSPSVLSHRADCSAANVTAVVTPSDVPVRLTALARNVPRTAEPLASHSAVSATEGIGASSFATLARLYPSRPPVNAYVHDSLGTSVNVDPREKRRSCCGSESARSSLSPPGSKGLAETPAFLAKSRAPAV